MAMTKGATVTAGGVGAGTRRTLVEAARGDRPLDLVIRGGDLLNVYTGETYPADIGILGDRIAIIDAGSRWGLTGAEEIDARGLTAIPGFVDTHVHIESMMVTPPNFARGVLPFGTTTVVIDPHEIGNVTGLAGVEYMLRASEGLPLRVYATVPSSVPAVPALETAGATFEAAEVAALLAWPRVLGVAELMDYPGVVRQEPRTAAIVEAGLASGKTLEGHCPLLAGRELAAYLAAGVDSDHECRGPEEMVEKLRAGMWVYGRENTFRHTAPFLAEVLRAVPLPWNAALCTDDIEPDDLLRNGHLDRGVRVLIARGTDPARPAMACTTSARSRPASWPMWCWCAILPRRAPRSSWRADGSWRATACSSPTSPTRPRRHAATACGSARSASRRSRRPVAAPMARSRCRSSRWTRIAPRRWIR